MKKAFSISLKRTDRSAAFCSYSFWTHIEVVLLFSLHFLWKKKSFPITNRCAFALGTVRFCSAVRRRCIYIFFSLFFPRLVLRFSSHFVCTYLRYLNCAVFIREIQRDFMSLNGFNRTARCDRERCFVVLEIYFFYNGYACFDKV